MWETTWQCSLPRRVTQGQICWLRLGYCLSRRGDRLLPDRTEAERANRSVLSLTRTILQLSSYFPLNNLRPHSLPCVCVFQRLVIFCRSSPQVLNNSSPAFSLACKGWAQGREGEQSCRMNITQVRSWHSCSPGDPARMSSSLGSADQDDIMFLESSLQPTAVAAILLFLSVGKISISISSCF